MVRYCSWWRYLKSLYILSLGGERTRRAFHIVNAVSIYWSKHWRTHLIRGLYGSYRRLSLLPEREESLIDPLDGGRGFNRSADRESLHWESSDKECWTSAVGLLSRWIHIHRLDILLTCTLKKKVNLSPYTCMQVWHACLYK